MSRFVNRKSILSLLIALTLVVAFAGGVLLKGSAKPTHAAAGNQHPFCQKLGQSIQASQGAQMWCFGQQLNGPGTGNATHRSSAAIRGQSSTSGFSPNVNAANPKEDVSPNGTQAYGQSETSIAAVGNYVVEAWNDSTTFFSPCPSPMYKEEATGYGFSSNGGKSFTDQGGLPNTNCATNKYGGDPSVEAWRPGGQAYFYISSLYPSAAANGTGTNYIALAACHAIANTISCSQPIIVAAPSESFFGFTSFLDKDFLSIDPVRGRLYMSYTEFGFSAGNADTVELAVCDIGTRTGSAGPSGGTPGHPVCHNGAEATGTPPTTSPYFIVAPTPANFCENEGAYPAVDLATGDVYVAYEHNWATNLTNSGPCASDPVKNVITYIPFSCVDIGNPANLPTSPCPGPAATNGVPVTSMDSAFIPGYNRFPMNDFPRIAVSDPAGTVSIVWNDARIHPAGDILLQSFSLISLSNIQAAPVRLNVHSGGWHMLPALRNVESTGKLSVTFYDRTSANTAVTNVYAAQDFSPLTTTTPRNQLVTNVASNWFNVSSDIVPNFGDYTDNYILATPSAPYTDDSLYVAWSDGRLGVPQPFESVDDADFD